MIHTVAQFIPIFVLFIVISYFKGVAKFSNTVLGKILAICIIIFYTFLDKLLGAVVCLILIFYYQSDVVEGMLNMDNDLNNTSEMEINNHINEDHVDDYLYFDNKKKKEGMMNYSEIYENNGDKDILINNEKTQNEFKQNNCVKGELTNKGVPVNYEMTEHVFPELKFRRGFCNPCLKDCEFSIIDQKLALEDKLRIPLQKK
jgi:hypothetical protein